jgi:hypothetical protein
MPIKAYDHDWLLHTALTVCMLVFMRHGRACEQQGDSCQTMRSNQAACAACIYQSAPLAITGGLQAVIDVHEMGNCHNLLFGCLLAGCCSTVQ